MYASGAKNLDLTPSEVCMVAAHIDDLRYAAKNGMKTVYVRRPTEDVGGLRESVKAKSEGGDVDAVVDSFEQLAGLF
jgi:FMN phosphatase YigB (HAD superfamily)